MPRRSTSRACAREQLVASECAAQAQILDSHVANLITRRNYREAAPLAAEALAIRERVAGPSHFLVAASLGTLTDLQHERANVQEAAATADRALEVAAKCYARKTSFSAS